MPARSVHKLDAFRARLGKEPDHAVAGDAGVSRSLVSGYRKKHGIGAYTGYKFGVRERPTAVAGPVGRASAGRERSPSAAGASQASLASARSFRGRRSALDAFSQILGAVPDSEVARQAGVTSENVRTYRLRRGIPAAWPAAPKGRPGAGAPAESGSRAVFTVSIEVGGVGYTYAIAAQSISEGVALAQDLAGRRHPGAVVKGLSHVAELLA